MSFQVSRSSLEWRVGMRVHCNEDAPRVSWYGLPLYRSILVLANRYGHPEFPLGAHCPDFSCGVSARQFSPIGVRNSLHFPAAEELIVHGARGKVWDPAFPRPPA